LKVKILKVEKSKHGFLVHYEYKGKRYSIYTFVTEEPSDILRSIASKIRYQELLERPIPQKIKELEEKEIEIEKRLSEN